MEEGAQALTPPARPCPTWFPQALPLSGFQPFPGRAYGVGGGLLWDTGCPPGRALFLDLGGFGSTLLQCLYSCPGGEVYLSQASPCSSLGGVIQSWAPSVFFPVLSEAQWTESNRVLALSPSPALAPALYWPQPCTGPSQGFSIPPFPYLTFTLGSGL